MKPKQQAVSRGRDGLGNGAARLDVLVWRGLLPSVALLLFVLALPCGHSAALKSSKDSLFVPDRYIVRFKHEHFEKRPAVPQNMCVGPAARAEGTKWMQKKKETVATLGLQLLSNVSSASGGEGVIRIGRHLALLNAVAVDLGELSTRADKENALEKLRADPAVQSLHRVAIVQLQSQVQDGTAPQPLTHILGTDTYTGVAEVAAHGFTGKGVKVGVIDSGIDYTHPALGGCSKIGVGCKVIAGYDYVGDDWDPDKIPVPDSDPKDCFAASHGTHVAGIIAANASSPLYSDIPWLGVAPSVQLGAYRVFGCQSGTTHDVVLHAMEDAYSDGMDIINLSIGLGSQANDGVLAMAALELMAGGVSVVISAGNEGFYGPMRPTSLGDASISVGSLDNPGFFSMYTMTIRTANGADVGIDVNLAFGPNSTSIKPGTISDMFPAGVEIVATSDLASTADACATDGSDIKADVTGKIALIRTGTCSLGDKAPHVKAKGAIGAIFYDSASNSDFQIPGIFYIFGINSLLISKGEGDKMRNLTFPLTFVSIEKNAKQFVSARVNRGLMSSYSSYGPDTYMGIRPNVAAPGRNIYSTVPNGDYNFFSGTSMAAPYVVGCIALLKEARPDICSAEDIKAALESTAGVLKLNATSDYLASVLKAGPGLINISAAITNRVKLTPSVISLPTPSCSATVTLQLENTGTTPVTFAIGHKPTISLSSNNVWRMVFGNIPQPAPQLGAVLTFFGRSPRASIQQVTVAAGGKADVRVEISADINALGNRTFFSGYITFTPVNSNAPALHATYLGHTTSFASIPALAEGAMFSLGKVCNGSTDVFDVADCGNSTTDPADMVTVNVTASELPSFTAALQRYTDEFDILLVDALDYTQLARPVGYSYVGGKNLQPLPDWWGPETALSYSSIYLPEIKFVQLNAKPGASNQKKQTNAFNEFSFGKKYRFRLSAVHYGAKSDGAHKITDEWISPLVQFVK